MIISRYFCSSSLEVKVWLLQNYLVCSFELCYGNMNAMDMIVHSGQIPRYFIINEIMKMNFWVH
jgi:hypothetical protein